VLQIVPAGYQLPVSISDAAVVASGGQLLIAGGLNSHRLPVSTVLLLNPVTGQTRPLGALARPTSDAAAALLNGQPTVFGGRTSRSVASVQTLRADGAARVSGQLPGARSGLVTVTTGTTTYLVGGSGDGRASGASGGGYPATVLATSDGSHFSDLARLPVPVSDTAALAAGQRLWIFGGVTLSGRLTSAIQQVDLRTGRARVVGQLPRPVAAETAFTLGGQIFLAGGEIPRSGGPAGSASRAALVTTSNLVFSYQPASGAVTVAGQLPVPIAHAAVALVGGTAFVVGGTDGSQVTPQVTTLRLVPAADATAWTAADRPTAATGRAGGPAAAAAAARHRPVPSAPWLASATGRGHLVPGSDPAVLPADVLVADHLNNRLVIIDPQGRIRWVFPRPGDLAPGQTFRVPDDAFFSPDGRDIIATQEDDQVISVINVAAHRIVYRYGKPGIPAAGPDRLDNPDDAMLTPGGDIVAADIKNCRIIVIAPPARRPLRIIGQTTHTCVHDPPRHFGSPNGAFPLTDGSYLVTEINGDWASEVDLRGHVRWSVHPPGVMYPSDTNEVCPGRYLTVDYSYPGQVVEFGPGGRLLWRFGDLNHPSLALPLPNGDVLLNDDFNDRIIVINPISNRIVWQYGHTGVPGRSPGYLDDPDGLDLVPPDSMLIQHAATMGQP